MQYERVDLVVVGGGIMGSMTAWRAVQRGLKVALVEQFRPGHARGSSHGCGRIYRYNYPEADYVRWMGGSFPLWHALEEEAGERLLFGCGCLDLALGPEGNAMLQACHEAMLSQDVQSEFLRDSELRARFPQFTPPPGVRSLYQSQGGVVAADRALEAAWQGVRRGEGRLFVDHRVERVDLEYDQPTVLARGTAFRGQRLVLAGGPWAPRLLPELARALTPTRQQFALLRPEDEAMYRPDRFPALIVHDVEQPYYMLPIIGSEAVKIARHGGAPPADPEVVQANPDPKELEKLRGYLKHWLPGAYNAPIEGGKTCFYTETPDTDFVIGAHPAREDVVVLAGFSGHGFKFAPLVGQVAVELAFDRGTAWPVERFSPTREALLKPVGR
ncbi:MAG: oxidoreductase [Candidatus Xenobia bacterium]